ncbi:MAG: hypothetical protein EOP49_39565, partial [Sphingobacteriales bacterium]
MDEINKKGRNIQFEMNSSASISALANAIEKLTTVQAERKQVTDEVTKLQERLNRAQSEAGKSAAELRLKIEEQNKANKVAAQLASEQEGSVKRLRAELSNLTSAYDKLSQSERGNAAIGGKLRDSILQVTEAIATAEQGTERFQRQVGKYPGSFNPAVKVLTEARTQLLEMQTAGAATGEQTEALAAIMGHLNSVLDNSATKLISAREAERSLLQVSGILEAAFGRQSREFQVITTMAGEYK